MEFNKTHRVINLIFMTGPHANSTCKLLEVQMLLSRQWFMPSRHDNSWQIHASKQTTLLLLNCDLSYTCVYSLWLFPIAFNYLNHPLTPRNLP